MGNTDKPGDIIGTWEDGDGHGLGVVVSTSRHRRVLTHEEATEKLAAHVVMDLLGRDIDPSPLREVLASRRPWRWRSVTRTEVENGDHSCLMECEPGQWCSEGGGSAFVDVLSVGNGEVYDLLDNPDRVPA